jgi:hypothetical protein
VEGQISRAATPAEIERFNMGIRQGGREVGFVTYRDGSIPSAIRGTPDRVDIPVGPNVATTSHTHPGDSAIFSALDIDTYRAGNFLPDTQHSVTGLKWPETVRYLGSVPNLESTAAQLARESALVTTTFTQPALDAANTGIYGTYRWLQLRLAELELQDQRRSFLDLLLSRPW